MPSASPRPRERSPVSYRGLGDPDARYGSRRYRATAFRLARNTPVKSFRRRLFQTGVRFPPSPPSKIKSVSQYAILFWTMIRGNRTRDQKQMSLLLGEAGFCRGGKIDSPHLHPSKLFNFKHLNFRQHPTTLPHQSVDPRNPHPRHRPGREELGRHGDPGGAAPRPRAGAGSD